MTAFVAREKLRDPQRGQWWRTLVAECLAKLSALDDWDAEFIFGLVEQTHIEPDQFVILSDIIIKVRSGSGGVAQG